jgi:hypothetical protein
VTSYSTGIVQLRAIGTKQNGDPNQVAMGFTVPRPTAQKLGHLVGRKFFCELVEDGVLFRLLPDEPEPMPEWAKPKEAS